MTDTGDRSTGGWVSARLGQSGFRTEIETRTHVIIADEPASVGGTDAGPTPYELLLGALSGCMAMTMHLYAGRKKWALESVLVQLRTARSHEVDCEHCDVEDVGIGRIERRVELAGALTDDQRRRLLEIADRCPVKQSLEKGVRIVSIS
jgi:uncharacterized OsmC-like protein